jgi:hypothetical protein
VDQAHQRRVGRATAGHDGEHQHHEDGGWSVGGDGDAEAAGDRRA